MRKGMMPVLWGYDRLSLTTFDRLKMTLILCLVIVYLMPLASYGQRNTPKATKLPTDAKHVATDKFSGKHHSYVEKKRKLMDYKNSKNGPSGAGLESKVIYFVQGGIIIPLGDKKINSAGISENLFANMSIGPAIGVGAAYKLSDHFTIGGRLRYSGQFNSVYTMNQVSIGPQVQYYIFPSNTFSPYVFGEADFVFAGIEQKANQYIYYPPSSYSIKNENSILVNKIAYRDPNAKVYIPVFGLAGGVGADYWLNPSLALALQVEFNAGFLRNNNALTAYFPDNTMHNYSLLVTVGLKFKSKN